MIILVTTAIVVVDPSVRMVPGGEVTLCVSLVAMALVGKRRLVGFKSAPTLTPRRVESG